MERLLVSKTKIGRGHHGDVYLWRLRFNDGTVHRVAVKKFKQPLSDEEVQRYEHVIRRLVEESAPVPKVGFVRHEGKWVQVMQLFGGANRGTKFQRVHVEDAFNRFKEHLERAGMKITNDCIEYIRGPGYVVPFFVDFNMLTRFATNLQPKAH